MYAINWQHRLSNVHAKNNASSPSSTSAGSCVQDKRDNGRQSVTIAGSCEQAIGDVVVPLPMWPMKCVHA